MNNIEELQQINKLQEEKIIYLEEELEKTKEHLKKYTAPSYKKKYYENNKEKILEKIKSDITLIFLYLVRLNVLKLNQHGQLKNI